MNSGTKTIFSLVVVFGAAWLALRCLLPLFSPFLLGAFLALTAEPTVCFLCRRLHLPRALSAGIGVSMAFSFLAMFFLMLCAFLVRELKALAGTLPDLESAVQTGITQLRSLLLQLSAHTPPVIQPLLERNVSGLFSNGTAFLNQAVRYLLGLAGNILSHVPNSALGLGTGVLSAFLISAKLPRIQRSLLRRLPREKLRTLLDGWKKVKSAVSGWLLAQCKLMAVTLALLALGFALLRIPHGLLWALGVALVDAFPVLGTGTVLLPWALICLLQGDVPRTAGLLGLYAAVTLTRTMLEPRLVGKHLGLDPLITLIALYAGYQLWGIGGMILAPMLATLAAQGGKAAG